MLKYIDVMVTFSEVPSEISLCINISGCKIRCNGCHSQYLWEDIGKPLTTKNVDTLIRNNEGISCLCLMGGDHDEKTIIRIFRFIKSHYPHLKTAWYSGHSNISYYISNRLYTGLFDYIKLGPYIEEFGPLNRTTTNQRMFKVTPERLIDITDKFWL